MCYSLTISFNRDFENLVRSLFSDKISLSDNKNAFFKETFGKDSLSFDLTDGYCSCPIYPLLLADNSEDEIEKIVQKYRRKGFSENKIKRVLSDKTNSQPKNPLNLREMLAEIVRESASLWIFVHQYEDTFAGEKLKSCETIELRIAELVNKKTEIPEDVIVKIKK